MKIWIKLLITGFTCFAGGFAAGYFTRKHTGEVTFEEVSEEELTKYIKADESSDTDKPIVVDIPEPAKEETAFAAQDGKKEAMLNNWRSEVKRYDTRSKEVPDDAVIFNEEGLDIPDIDLEKDLNNRPDIHVVDIEDWDECIGSTNPEYDPIELTWYEKDNVVCDDHDEPVERPEKFIGFDIERVFEKNEETTGDPDIRIIVNERYRGIYHITRVESSYAIKRKREEFDGDDDDEDDEEDYE